MQIGTPVPSIQGSVSSSGAQGTRNSSPPVLCEPGHGHRPAQPSEDLRSSVGGAAWSGAS